MDGNVLTKARYDLADLTWNDELKEIRLSSTMATAQLI